MKAIYIKELSTYFGTLIAYLFIGVFLVSSGILVWYLPETNVLDTGFADLTPFFQQSPYVLLLLIPGITMRLFADEQRSGTLEWLLTKPLQEWELVLGKFLAAYSIVCIAILPTWIYMYSIYTLANPMGNIDISGIVGSYIGLYALAAIFTSIGVFSSVCTDNQIIAFIIALVLCYFFYDGFQLLSTLIPTYSYAYLLQQLGIGIHYDNMSKGWITLKDTLYFISTTGLALYATVMVLNIRKWPLDHE